MIINGIFTNVQFNGGHPDFSYYKMGSLYSANWLSITFCSYHITIKALLSRAKTCENIHVHCSDVMLMQLLYNVNDSSNIVSGLSKETLKGTSQFLDVCSEIFN